MATNDASWQMWDRQPTPWNWLVGIVEKAAHENAAIGALRDQLRERTGTRLIDWLDHVGLAEGDATDADLEPLGYRWSSDRQAWLHAEGLMPPVVRVDGTHVWPARGLGLKVESVQAFLAAQPWAAPSEPVGDPLGSLRYAVVASHDRWSLSIVERHGDWGWKPRALSDAQRMMMVRAWELFANRPRPTDAQDERRGFRQARARFDEVAAVLGPDVAADRFFACERAYWQGRNRAGRVQRARQQRAGMGWANHDHHTYRSSRQYFRELIATLEHFGFVPRERFYAGAEAGWGAQVLEHRGCGVVIFADVDLSPDEVTIDFAHQDLAPRQELGTVGLWCGLHGEAFLAAGMHHLECQFDFDMACQQLRADEVHTMDPFTNFEYLRQAFTEGETWLVDEERVATLQAHGSISPQQAQEFLARGARGSHLEILQRQDAYKGFNQTGISDIISRTDPRKRAAVGSS